VIADLTRKNPNVFYELAIAHCYAKQTVLICQDINSDIPFDLKVYRAIEYNETTKGLLSLKKDLINILAEIKDRPRGISNPVVDYGKMSKLYPTSKTSPAPVMGVSGRLLKRDEASLLISKVHIYPDFNSARASLGTKLISALDTRHNQKHIPPCTYYYPSHGYIPLDNDEMVVVNRKNNHNGCFEFHKLSDNSVVFLCYSAPSDVENLQSVVIFGKKVMLFVHPWHRLNTLVSVPIGIISRAENLHIDTGELGKDPVGSEVTFRSCET